MTEERRSAPVAAADDGGQHLVDGELVAVPAAQLPPVAPRASRPPAEDVSSPAPSPRARDSSPSARRARGRMAIRIPDDEVSRPTVAALAPEGASPSPPYGVPRPRMQSQPTPTAPQALPPLAELSSTQPALQPTRIISIEASPGPVTPVMPLPPRPEGGTAAIQHDGAASATAAWREDSWTPYQPTAVDDAEAQARPPAKSEDLIPVESESDPIMDGPDSAEPLDLDSPEPQVIVPSKPPPAPPLLQNARLSRPDPSEVSSQRPAFKPTSVSNPPPAAIAPLPPRDTMPSAPPRGLDGTPAVPPPRGQQLSEPEGEDVRFDDDDPPLAAPLKSALPKKLGGNATESGEQEIAAEDLVSVESAPFGARSADGAFAPAPQSHGQKQAERVEKDAPPQTSSERGQALVEKSNPSIRLPGAPSLMNPSTPGLAFSVPSAAVPSASAGAPAPSHGGAAAALPPMRAKIASIPPPIPPASGGKTPSPEGALAAPAVAPTPSTPPKPSPGGRAPLVIVPPHAGVAAPQSEGPGSRRKARPWWEELFNDDYVRTMAKITDEQIARESDFIEDSLGVAKGGTMLDLCCGTGRHAIELSRRGYEVVGYDLSLSMLARAADEAQERDQKLNFLQGDVREMTFDEAFDGVYCWNTSFGFFDEDTNAKVVERVHKSLKKGGQFVLDVVNRDFIAQQAPSLAWFEGDGCVCMDEMSIDWIASRMKVKRTMMMDDGRSKEIDYSVRIYSLHELGRILHEQGFRVAEVSGRVGTPGVFFGGESPRTLILAEKR